MVHQTPVDKLHHSVKESANSLSVMHDNNGTDSAEHLVVMTHQMNLTKIAATYNLINGKHGDILVQATQEPKYEIPMHRSTKVKQECDTTYLCSPCNQIIL
jgi:hypothetical protein